MQSAFRFHRACPSPGTLAFTIGNRISTGPAAYTGVAAVVERVIGDFVLGDIAPNVRLGPVSQWVDLDQLKLGIPFYDAGFGAGKRLISTDGADPCVIAFN